MYSSVFIYRFFYSIFYFLWLVFSIFFCRGCCNSCSVRRTFSLFRSLLIRKIICNCSSCTAVVAVGRNLSTISFVSCFFSAFNVSPDVVFETDTFGVSGFRFAASFLTESLAWYCCWFRRNRWCWYRCSCRVWGRFRSLCRSLCWFRLWLWCYRWLNVGSGVGAAG